MSYYRLEFGSHLAEEGEGWRSKARTTCGGCNRQIARFDREFPVPEDSIEHVDAGVWDWTDAEFIAVAGILLVRADFSERLCAVGIKGFSLREASIHPIGEAEVNRPISEYRWMVVEGRCDVHDVWERVIGICDVCRTPITERSANVSRSIRLRAPMDPAVDICRGREDAAGIIVDDRFRTACVEVGDDVLRFLPVPVDPA